MKALINSQQTTIHQIVADGDTFPVSISYSWVDVPADTTTHDSWIAGAVVKWVAPVPPTLDEIYDLELQTQKILKAFILALNDGSFPIGTSMTGPQIKTIIRNKM